MNEWFKRNSAHLLIIGIFALICFIYFTPAFQGKALGQSDVIGAQSTQKEIMDYRSRDTTILWTNQIFGGMPAYQIWAPYSSSIATVIVNTVNRTFPNPVGTVLILLLGTYFLFNVLKVTPWLAGAGAIAFAFSSYNIILFVAGHANQVFAIAFFAPVIAGMILTFRGKHLLGVSVTSLFMSIELKANHIQMTYYLSLAIAVFLIIELYHSIKTKNTIPYFKSVLFFTGACLLAVAVNASLIWSTFEYSKDSYRGKSNLTQNAKEPTNGLDRNYAYQYSQGVAECLTFLVPNAYGGGSGTEILDQNSETAKVFINKGVPEAQAVNYAQQISGGDFPGLTLYWGEKRPSTAGPYYFGATIFFLFILGLIIVQHRIKWWMLATVILTMLLSFGGNWPLVSDLFFKYFPLYNKFRAVESILAVTSICFPILAILAVQEIIDTKDKAIILKKLKLGFYITGGLLLILIAIPELLLNFRPSDQSASTNYLVQALKGDNAVARDVTNAIVKDRVSLERTDAIRSLVFVVLTFITIWVLLKQKISFKIASIILLTLTLVDLWQIDKRYLKESNFTEKEQTVVNPREVDLTIAKDTDPNFRVYDATAGIKMDVLNPFFHKSIGGYSAARLKRFDELIDNQLSGQSVNMSVLDMLNTKYFIMPDSSNKALRVQQNPNTCGNAWFINNIRFVNNADEEMAALKNFEPNHEAIINQEFKNSLNSSNLNRDSAARIELVKYNPDHLTYSSNSNSAQIAVFSEIYYKNGWTMLVDGIEKPYFRVNYLLRAAQLPAGKHTVEFVFHPSSYYTGEKISLASSVCLILLLAGSAFGSKLYALTKRNHSSK
ncbi:YfhO family protein [Mucilaginibacter sp. SMC90]|uniref:YfhO family protein n=1 Tax=Mucilaginibacter sp. SMC90 TaxID=2929803 RepID=UPI001FB37F67|nr:YfhO family protein [Mucilaginibacter sp. SMC90]UOE52146.1 YfhO family protein [Mucilaginibacter sp. SMC90]